LYSSHAKQIRDLDELAYQAKATLPTGNRRTSGDSRMKKVGGHCGVKEKVGGPT